MGITHHGTCVNNVQAIGNLALLRGMVGRPAADSCLSAVFERSRHRLFCRRLAQTERCDLRSPAIALWRKLPTTPGRDTMACIEGAANGELKFGFCLGGIFLAQTPIDIPPPNQLRTSTKSSTSNTTLNMGHAHGLARETIILPVLARDEEPQPTTQESMFNYIRLSDGGPRRHEGTRQRDRRHCFDCRTRLCKGEGEPINRKQQRFSPFSVELVRSIPPNARKRIIFAMLAGIGRTSTATNSTEKGRTVAVSIDRFAFPFAKDAFGNRSN